ncbi:hypothetical protein SAMN05216582_10298 [Selenomonas ruminantium]|uniref:Uncharacterized protein n=1 Tax=Selenomonas ruminantium TaxID=971 RepID=A0A1M6RIX6_SELRU|nr:hypothetical protein SAMN05216582_10298 [Selenomonas ruminantium]
MQKMGRGSLLNVDIPRLERRKSPRTSLTAPDKQNRQAHPACLFFAHFYYSPPAFSKDDRKNTIQQEVHEQM